MKKLFLKRYYIYTMLLSLVTNVVSFSVFADSNQESIKNCLISAATIKKSKHVTSRLFIDVRSNDIFNKKHIPNSINIPLHLIATKAFLKNRDVIIVGNGWNESSLIQKCIQLKTKGFKSVKVLSGGIIKEVRLNFMNNKLSLTPFIPFILISSEEFFNNKIEKKFVPFVISNKNKKLIKSTLPHAKIYSLKATKRQLLKGLTRMGKGKNPIVIFSENNPMVNAVLGKYLKKPLRNIYYFKGGFNAYQMVNNLNRMTSVSNKHKRSSTKKPVSCAN